MYVRGKPWLLHVDDQMVMKQVGVAGNGDLIKEPAFLKLSGRTKAAWPFLLQKAFAKTKRNYNNARVAPDHVEALYALTGVPVITVDLTSLSAS